MMRKSAARCALAICVVCIVTACSGSGVDETAASTTYNAVYAGAATLTPISGSTAYMAVPLAATLTMSQLASTVTGTIVVTGVTPVMQDTLLAAGTTGHTTPSGLDLTIVQPLGCATHLSGPLTLGADGVLRGTLEGSDCHAAGQDDLRLTLSLSRQ